MSSVTSINLSDPQEEVDNDLCWLSVLHHLILGLEQITVVLANISHPGGRKTKGQHRLLGLSVVAFVALR